MKCPSTTIHPVINYNTKFGRKIFSTNDTYFKAIQWGAPIPDKLLSFSRVCYHVRLVAQYKFAQSMTSLQRLDSFGRKLGNFESRNDLNVWSKTSCLLHLYKKLLY